LAKQRQTCHALPGHPRRGLPKASIGHSPSKTSADPRVIKADFWPEAINPPDTHVSMCFCTWNHNPRPKTGVHPPQAKSIDARSIDRSDTDKFGQTFGPKAQASTPGSPGIPSRDFAGNEMQSLQLYAEIPFPICMFSYVFCPNFQTSVVMSKLPISLLFHGATPQNCLLFSLNPKNCKSHGGHSSDGYYESMLPVTLQMRTHSSSRPTPDDRPENHVLLPFLPHLNPPDKLRPLYITSNSVPRPDLLHLPKSVSPPVPYTRPLLTYLLTYSSDLRIPFQHLAFKRPQSLPVPS
jgi:hypothetical protein